MMKNSTQSSDTKPTYCAQLGHNFPRCPSKNRTLTPNSGFRRLAGIKVKGGERE